MAASLGIDATQSQAQSSAVQTSAANENRSRGMSFGDILGVINPLQHIPVISTIYRELTGDTISPAAQVAGDGLYGGIIGIATSLVNEVVEGTTGKDIGGHIWATLFGDDNEQAAPAAPSTETPAQPAAPPSATTTQPISAISAPSASTPGISTLGASDANAATASVPAGPSSYFQTLQRGGHTSHGVPLTASVPTGAARIPVPPLANAPAGTPGSPAAIAAPAAIDPANMPTSLLPSASGTQAPTGSAPAGAASASVTSSVQPPPDVAAAMMKALDKYKAMSQQENAAASVPTS